MRDDLLHLRLGRRVLIDELLTLEELAELRVARLIDRLRERLQLRLVAQLQADHDMRALAGGEFEQGRGAERARLHLARGDERLRVGRRPQGG